MITNKLAPLAAVLLFGIAACNDTGSGGPCPTSCPTIHSSCDNSTTTDGKCICDPGYTQCGSACVSLDSDQANCGACGNVCDATSGYTCNLKNCICGNGMFGLCPADGGPDVCSDPTTDKHNCGFCGNDCGQLECSNGSCNCNSPLYECIAQTLDMDGGVIPDAGVPYCADISNDIDNCGKCGTKCGPTNQTHDARAKAWQCVSTTGGPGICACRTGYFQCSPPGTTVSDCVDLATSTQNCGACNNACVGGVCNNSHCDCSAPGYVLCPTAPPGDKFACHLPESTVTHCGNAIGDNCGTDCTALISGAICDQGNCACTINKDAGTICGLDAGLTPFCADLTSDIGNCGGCFDPITPPFNTCADGRPSCDVSQGEQLCALPDASFCTNINRGDPSHCGACAGPTSDCNTWNGANSVCESSSCSCAKYIPVDAGATVTDGGPAAYCIVNANAGTCSCNSSQACIPEAAPLSWGHDIFPLFQTGPGGVTSASKLGCTASGCHTGGEAAAAGHLDLSDVDAGYAGLLTGPIFGGKTCTPPPGPTTTGTFDCPCVAAALPDKSDPTKSSVLSSLLTNGNFPQKCNTQQIHQDPVNMIRLAFSPCAQLIVNDWIDAGALP